jgi:hypothetical protein
LPGKSMKNARLCFDSGSRYLRFHKSSSNHCVHFNAGLHLICRCAYIKIVVL